jgi:hypothetical protein
MLALLLHVLALLPAPSTCLTNYGKTACGYHCQAAHGDVQCARTSAGICGFTDSQLVCWDPPDSVRAHYGDKAPRPECMQRSGQMQCGYNCASRDGGEIQCSQTPDGICVAASRGVVCWDPPISSYCADDRPLPRPRCIQVDGVAACGFGCLAKNGDVACAQTPTGTCINMPTGIVCNDSEAPPMCGVVPCRADDPQTGRPWCRTSPKK